MRQGDVMDPGSLEGVGRDVDAAYFLIHAMAGGRGFAARERQGALNFARMAKRDGVRRVVYLGGLGEQSASEHLRSREQIARILAARGPPLTYFRAAMVVGAGSESFRAMYHLVKRLPVMVAPAWLRTRTQPIGIEDVVAYLGAAAVTPASRGREVQIGGPDVLSYGDMLHTVAGAIGRRRPAMVPVPLLSPKLSSLWIGLVTPVDAGVARPLVEGLSTETVVTDPSGAELFDVRPEPFADALERALREQ